MAKKNAAIIFAKYIVSYIVIIIVFLILVAVLYNTNYLTSRNVTDTYLSASLDYGLQSLEEIVMQLNAVSSHVNSDSNITKLMKQKTPLPYSSRAEIIKFNNRFLTIGNINLSVDRMILALPNGIVFSSEGLSHESPDLFYGDFFRYDGMSIDEWNQKMSEEFHFWESTGVTAKNIQQDEYLTYNCPNARQSPRLMALISKKELVDLLLPKEDQSYLGLKVMHEDTVLLDTQFLTEGLPIQAVIERRSEQLNLTVSVSVPTSFYADRIQSLTGTLAFFTLSVVTLGIIMSIMFALTISKPVRNLATLLNKRGEKVESNPTRSLQKLLTKMDTKLGDSMEKTAEMQKTLSAIEFQLLIATDAPCVPNHISIQLGESSIVLLLLQLPGDEMGESGAKHRAEQLLGTLRHQDIHLFGLNETTYVILHPWNGEGISGLDDLAKSVAQQLSPLSVKWGVSQPISHISEIKFAYLEAEFALTRGSGWNHKINYFSEIEINISNPLFSLSRYNELDMLLAGNNIEKIAPFFQNLRTEILDCGLTTKEIRQIAYLIRSILFNYFKEHMDYGRFFHVPHLNCGLPDMHCIREIEEICMMIAKENYESKSSHNEKLRDDIIRLINDEYQNPNLSLSWLADKCCSTPKYISNFISEQLGKSYSDYIQQTRLEHGKRLLQTTNMTVNQIALQVGYMSSNAFYKGFRRFYHISPSDLRKNNQVPQ